MTFRGEVLIVLWLAVSYLNVVAASEPPSAELAAAIGKWKNAVAGHQQFEITGQRIVYNDIFATEKWSNVKLQFQRPDRVRFEISPFHPEDHSKSSRRTSQTGELYRLEADYASLWMFSARSIRHCQPGTGRLLTSERESLELMQDEGDDPRIPPPPALPEDPPNFWRRLFQRPAGPLGAAWFARDSMLPSIFAIQQPDWADRFRWTLTHKSADEIRLNGFPQEESERKQYQQISVLLDRKSGRPLAQRLISPGGNITQVMIFKHWSEKLSSAIDEFRPREWDVEEIPLLPPPQVSKKSPSSP